MSFHRLLHVRIEILKLLFNLISLSFLGLNIKVKHQTGIAFWLSSVKKVRSCRPSWPFCVDRIGGCLRLLKVKIKVNVLGILYFSFSVIRHFVLQYTRSLKHINSRTLKHQGGQCPILDRCNHFHYERNYTLCDTRQNVRLSRLPTFPPLEINKETFYLRNKRESTHFNVETKKGRQQTREFSPIVGTHGNSHAYRISLLNYFVCYFFLNYETIIWNFWFQSTALFTCIL